MFGNRYFGPRYYGDRYWGGGGDIAPPDPTPPPRRFGALSPKDMQQADREAREFRDTTVRNERALRDSIERAFSQALDEPKPAPLAPMPKAERKELARAVVADLKLDGIDASLRQIDRLMRVYEAQLIAQREQEWEDTAVAILLLAN